MSLMACCLLNDSAVVDWNTVAPTMAAVRKDVGVDVGVAVAGVRGTADNA
jgi:nicotinamide mononucleotide (NMN) deamidase PncC